ncbi:Aste57867_16224 [Aphanomyces stellatus]|uniref:glucan endo-1,3-beta-D-glucosidase n=1 Tax=Aphanomyces stellatus TaxID=120398 RepID=A0A485L4Z2_9STRA|nr:hypothetical protein As57867_016167 [Aphanomyces stellatus]VFT93002.1 Aste57867_16224 [Aphanomyces stellatus]
MERTPLNHAQRPNHIKPFLSWVVPKPPARSSKWHTTLVMRGLLVVAALALGLVVLVPHNASSPLAPAMAIVDVANGAAACAANRESPLCLFQPSGAQSWFAPPRNLSPTIRDRPIPTNRWWGNLISSARDDSVPEKRVWTNPYAVVLLPQGIVVSFPFASRYFEGRSGNGNGAKSYSHAYSKDITLGMSTGVFTQPFQVTTWDDLGVTVRLEHLNTHQSLETTLVSGMAYVTASYTNLQPQVSTASPITSINDQRVEPADIANARTLQATKFVLRLANGQSWVVYSSTPLVLTLLSATTLQSPLAFTGDIRVALVRSAADLAAHDKHHGCVVKGANLTHDRYNYGFDWATAGDCTDGLLHFALPHHVSVLDTTQASAVAGMSALESATRGAMTPIVTTAHPPRWRCAESLVPADMYPRTRPSVDRAKKTNLLFHLTNDINSVWDMPADGSYYFNGKKAQKYASLCLMASDAAIVGTDTRLLDRCRGKLEALLSRFAHNGFAHPLVYDDVYKGIVTRQGFDEANTYADFGNTIYNDHHYHFGYWVAAAAIANVVHPHMADLGLVNQRVSFLIRDVANADATSRDFPTFRMFDWFKGHSYSHGIVAAADGKDLESTSEDVNFYYAMALFGEATGQVGLAQLGRLMLSLNVRAIQTYFLMESTNVIHPEQIRANHVPGIYFDNKVSYTTWFSTERKSIHMIQMLPVTPVTEFVRTHRFVLEEWTDILAKLAPIANNDETDAAISLLYLNYATINPDLAMQKLQTVALDDGLSRSWALYMAASRYV